MEKRSDIQNLFKSKGLTPTRIALELQVNVNSIYGTLSGKMTSQRISDYLEKKLNTSISNINKAWNNQ